MSGDGERTYGVLGDVHANARALRAALDQVRQRPIDGLVLLGDLLTYGPDVDEVLDLVSAEIAGGATVILGNHDQMYLELLAGQAEYYDGLPSWIKESVDYTLDRLAVDPGRFLTIPFERSLQLGPIYVAHANAHPERPDGGMDWRYVARADEFAAAAGALRGRGAWAGMFGHTHRTRIVEWPAARGLGDDNRDAIDGWQPVNEGDALVMTAGAVGQPRNAAARSTVVWMRHGDPEDPAGDSPRSRCGPISVAIDTLRYDVAGHVAAVQAMPLTAGTRAELTNFFRPASAR